MPDFFFIKNILFVQDSSPCIRTIKLATALASNGLHIHLAHRNRTPDEVYGYGNASFTSITRLPKYRFKDIQAIKRIIADQAIHLVHFHNQPDELGAKLIKADLGIPVIYDQHDFLSFKHRLSGKERKYERICNEEADGTVYITDSYRNEVAKYYALTEHSLCFANYLSGRSILEKEAELPKCSSLDGKTHLVYIGRISERKKDHRNIMEVARALADEDQIVHIYPSRNRAYPKYNRMDHVIVHEKLPYHPLISEISQYDFGLTIFNHRLVREMPHVQYALGNKTFDYLSAGLPVLTQECLQEVAKIVLENGFGFTLEHFNEDKSLSADSYHALVENIRQKRGDFTMENQIHRLIDFYQTTI
jgi:glycosyltransferase involved in cell wall biosynthesis